MDATTIKIGRWTYPLTVQGKKVLRNEKRDGSGQWLQVTDKQVADNDLNINALIAAFGAEKPQSADYSTLRDIYGYIFDSFATDYDEVASQFNLRPGKAKAAVSRLVRLGLVAVSHETREDGKGKRYVVQSLETYDVVSRYEALATFDEKVPNDVKIPNPSLHGGVKGAQTRKPGKSTWKIGSTCPQGHTLKKGDVYTMPNGRNICRVCRSEYKSVQARKAASA